MVARLLLDFTATKSINNGLGQFSCSLGREILSQKPNSLKIDVLVPKGREDLFPLADGYRFKNSVFRDTTPNFIKAPFRRQWRYDLWHVTNQNSGFLPVNSNTPMLLTVHDLNFLRERQQDQWQRKALKIQKKINNAMAVSTISHFVKGEIESHLELDGKPIHVIYNGGVESKAKAVAPAFFQQQTPFLFTIGECLPKKNMHVLLGMMKHLPEYHLVIAGKDTTDYAERLKCDIKELGLSKQVSMIGCVSNAERAWCYENMTGFVFPSLTEGFGLPIIEAMSYGKPVFCSNLTSLPEIGGRFPFYWENFNPQEMAHKVVAGLVMLQSQPLYLAEAAEHASKFSWKDAAAHYLELYDRLLSKVNPSRARVVAKVSKDAVSC